LKILNAADYDECGLHFDEPEKHKAPEDAYQNNVQDNDAGGEGALRTSAGPHERVFLASATQRS
jgi:hypothetical protein